MAAEITEETRPTLGPVRRTLYARELFSHAVADYFRREVARRASP